MGVLGERAGDGRADPLGGTVGGEDLGVRRFQRLELAEETVVLGVGDLRRVEDVVRVVGAFDLLPQRGRLLGRARASPRGGLLAEHGLRHAGEPADLG